METSAEGEEAEEEGTGWVGLVEWVDDDDDEEVRLVGAGRGRAEEVAVLSASRSSPTTTAAASNGGANSPKLAVNASITLVNLSNLSSATLTRWRRCQFSFSRWRIWVSARSK